MNFENLYNKELDEERNIILKQNKSQNRKILTKTLKYYNDSVECKNFNEYEREQELLKLIFNFKNNIYD